MKTLRLEIYRDKSKQWRSRVKSGNSKIMFVSSESYKQRASVIKGLSRLGHFLQDARAHVLNSKGKAVFTLSIN